MQPVRDFSTAQLAYWAHLNPRPCEIGAPDEMALGILPAIGLITDPTEEADLGLQVVRVAFQPTSQELVALAAGGTIWLSTWGGLPMHMLELLYLPAEEWDNGCVRMGLNAFYLVDGKSPRGDFHHVVVYRGHEVVHDPHPSGDGIAGHPTGVYYFVVADPARQPLQS